MRISEDKLERIENSVWHRDAQGWTIWRWKLQTNYKAQHPTIAVKLVHLKYKQHKIQHKNETKKNCRILSPPWWSPPVGHHFWIQIACNPEHVEIKNNAGWNKALNLKKTGIEMKDTKDNIIISEEPTQKKHWKKQRKFLDATWILAKADKKWPLYWQHYVFALWDIHCDFPRTKEDQESYEFWN